MGLVLTRVLIRAQLTDVLLVPVTEARNCCVSPAVRLAVLGLTATATVGLRLIVAVSDLVLSATLVARTVAVCAVGIEAGAVYSPLVLIVPAPAITAQVTAVLLVPVTDAVNCCVIPAVRFAVFGLTVTATVGLRFTVAVSDLLGSATLVARNVAGCAVG